MAIEDIQYLDQGFNPRKVKMADLRGILLANDVGFSLAAKKRELVEIFLQTIASRAEELRLKRSSVVASSAGIVNYDDDSANLGDDSADE